MTWTTQAANQTTFEFLQFGGHGVSGGGTMILHLHLIGTTVGGTLNNALNVTVPNNGILLSTCSGLYSYRDNGTFGAGVWEATASGVVINFYRSDKTNWSASTAATDIRASIELSLQ
jgi:hypothetical protein